MFTVKLWKGYDKVNTKELALLYYMDIATDEEGSQCIGRNELSSLLSVTPQTATKIIAPLIVDGHIKERKMPFAIGRGHGYKMQYWITAKGVLSLLAHGTRGKECYDLLIANKLEDAIKEARRLSKNGKPKKVSSKQLSLFGDK